MQNFDAIWEILIEAFSKDLRRSFTQQKDLLNHPNYKLIPKYNDVELMGFIGLWEFDTFVFIEHLAVKSTMRGCGYGKQLIEQIISSYSKLIILEVEKPHTDIDKRRINFYKRLGFHLNEYAYVQPPYYPEGNAIDLLIMSYPTTLSDDAFNQIKYTLYTEVYHTEIWML